MLLGVLFRWFLRLAVPAHGRPVRGALGLLLRRVRDDLPANAAALRL
jgi:hypothetical protein